jgi:3-oxoacyl-[acyl-carrier-protein] synthase-3
MNPGILGLGTYVPEKVLSNHDIEKLVETSDEWITERTGIKERRIAKKERVSQLGAKAALKAIKDAGINSSDIDCIVLASASPEYVFPATACLVQKELGLEGIPAFDVQAVCTGFNYALTVASTFIKAGLYRNILVIGAEKMSAFVDWSDRTTCILFGDGAGAVVLGEVEKGFGVISSVLGADGRGNELLYIPAGGSGLPASFETVSKGEHFIKMNGREVFKWAVRVLAEVTKKVISEEGLTIEDIDYFIFHQANKRIIDAVSKSLNIPPEKMVVNIDRVGNTSTASIPLALEDLRRERGLNKGDLLLLASFGAGLTWGANIVRWSKEGS